jgi:hypothetical protein
MARCDFIPTTLAVLEMGGAVQVGPLSFSDFDYTTMGPDMPLAASVTVSPVNRANQGEFGLLFTSSWSNPTPNGAFQTALIRYKVTTTGPDIADAELFAIPIAVLGTPGQDDGFVTVSEGLFIVQAGQIPTLTALASVDTANNVRNGEERGLVDVRRTRLLRTGATPRHWHSCLGDSCILECMGTSPTICSSILRYRAKC